MDKEQQNFYPKLCGSTLFYKIVELRNKSAGNQDECFKDFLRVIDFNATSYIPERTLHSYSSACKNAKKLPKDCGCIRFGDAEVCKTFRDEINNNPDEVYKRIEEFANKYFIPKNHKSIVRALLELIDEDKSIDEHNRSLYINPGFRPSLKDEFLKDDATIHFYNFLLGVWYYVYQYSEDSEEGRPTIEYWGNNKQAGKTNDDEPARFLNITISYETTLTEEEQNQIEAVVEKPTQVVMPWGKVPDLSTFDPEDDDGVLVMEVSKVETVYDKFSKYVDEALKIYTLKKGFLDNQERRFRDFYVCNNVCQRMRRPIPRGTSLADIAAEDEKNLNRPIENITVDSLGKHFDIFTGIGGMGKSMMLHKFLLDELETYKPGRRVPIMIYLRRYKPDERSIEFLLLSELKRFDPDLQLSDLYYLLDSGRAVCLLDAMDEIDKQYINEFQDELDVMKDSRRDSYYVLSSRDIPQVRTLNNFFEYDIQNLELEQACDLISRLNPNRVSDELKEDFIKKLKYDAFHFNRDEKRNFVGNPLFLSLMIRTYDMMNDIPQDRYVFYEKTYEAMAYEYDSRTKRLSRPFFTKLNEKTFHKYFSEFCGLTYADSKYYFSRDLMLDYFNQVIEDNGLSTSPEMFEKDITEKLCLIYKDGDVYEFIHRSFQEYFAACYYLSMLTTQKDIVQETLSELDEKIKEDETISMMFGMDSDSTEKYIILPFLEKMFSEKDDEKNYENYLLKYYPQIEYVTGDLDEDMCGNDSQKSAMFWFIKKQYDIDYGYLSGEFEYIVDYADDYEQYFWLEERWFGYSSNGGNMRLCTKNEVPSRYLEAYHLNDTDDIESDTGFLCAIDVEGLINGNSHNESARWVIFEQDNFRLREQFNQFKSLFEELKEKYNGAQPVKKRFGLKK